MEFLETVVEESETVLALLFSRQGPLLLLMS